MLERFLERVFVPQYKDHFIIEDRLLIASMAVPLKLDITTEDKITPREIEFRYRRMMENRYFRGNQNTRPRDYYDICIVCYDVR